MPPAVQVGAILIEDWPLMTQLLDLESEPHSELEPGESARWLRS